MVTMDALDEELADACGERPIEVDWEVIGGWASGRALDSHDRPAHGRLPADGKSSVSPTREVIPGARPFDRLVGPVRSEADL